MSPSTDLTLFMAVPTIYSRLIEIYDQMSPEDQKKATNSCKQFRLQVSGSAPLPSPLKGKWKTISGGQILLERYGMTETGMIISCGMEEGQRIDGHIGVPMPGVTVRLWDDATKRDVTDAMETPGEVQVKGDLLFKEYWQLPDKTKEDFTEDGWFKSGDIGLRTKETGFYRLQGRSSVDIIKVIGHDCVSFYLSELTTCFVLYFTVPRLLSFHTALISLVCTAWMFVFVAGTLSLVGR